MFKSGIAFILGCALSVPAVAQVTEVVPNDRKEVAGTSTFTGPLANSQRTYQLLIRADQLSNLAGVPLTGLTWRIPTSATAPWPVSDISFANYDIYLSGSVDPANRSLTFADNVVGPQTQVRAGALDIEANAFPSGGNPNEFGSEIKFDAPWLYTGGNLLIEIRHTGSTGTSRSVDGMAATGGAAQGYGTLFSAAWTGNYTGVSGSQGNFSIVELTAIPEPASAIVALGGIGLLAARRRR